jgi:hypothetical protein
MSGVRHPPTPPTGIDDAAPSGWCDRLVVCATIFNFLRHKFQSDRSALGGLRTYGQSSFTGNDPTVWTGRALQAECDDLEMIGLAHLYRPLHGAFMLLAIMDIRAHPISFSEGP